MEEIVRAFNYVIEKGWVSTKSNKRPGSDSPDPQNRRSIGPHLNGVLVKSRRPTVSDSPKYYG
jgi:hypothetical protein